MRADGEVIRSFPKIEKGIVKAKAGLNFIKI